MSELEQTIRRLIKEGILAAGRPDLFRTPLIAVSSADDERYPRLKSMIGPWHKNPRELLGDANSVLSIFVPFTGPVVQSVLIEEPVSRTWGEAYVALNDLFGTLGSSIAAHLIGEGHSALSIASTHTYDPATLESGWSHRSAAAIAGLGSFGVNRMLFTEKGSAGRYATILTSARLEPGTEPAPEYCRYHLDGSCLACLKACPVGALSVDAFDRQACHRHLLGNARRLSDIGFCDVCGKCLARCPAAWQD